MIFNHANIWGKGVTGKRLKCPDKQIFNLEKILKACEKSFLFFSPYGGFPST
jgi:hypothetical protein